MVRVYFDTNTREILSETEAGDKARETVEAHPEWCVDTLTTHSFSEIWDMLTENAKETIMNETIDNVLENEFYYREFEEHELE